MKLAAKPAGSNAKIAAFIKDINKKFEGRAVLQSGKDIAWLSAKRIRTGSLGLDIALNGGVPLGMITEMFGEESGGKTTMAMKICGTLQREMKDRASILWVAAEPFDKKWGNQCGASIPFSDKELKLLSPMDRKWAAKIKQVGTFALLQSKDGESALQTVVEATLTHQFQLIVVDSVAALQPAAEDEKDMDQKSMGGLPRLMSQFLRKMASAFNMKGEQGEFNETAVVLINQIRDQVGVYGHPEPYSPGGRALRHAAACRVRFKRAEIHKDTTDKTAYARRTRVKVEKNKVGSPFKEAEYDFYFDDHETNGIEFAPGDINVYEETRLWGVKHGVIEQVGNTNYSYKGKSFRGKAAVELWLFENPKVLVEIQDAILSLTTTSSKES